MKHKGYRKRYRHVEWGHYMYASHTSLKWPGMSDDLKRFVIYALQEAARDNGAKIKPNSIETHISEDSDKFFMGLGSAWGRCILLLPKKTKKHNKKERK